LISFIRKWVRNLRWWPTHRGPKPHADGLCTWCGWKVPDDHVTHPNRFYCSDACRQRAWNYYHPNDPWR